MSRDLKMFSLTNFMLAANSLMNLKVSKVLVFEYIYIENKML